MKEVFYSKEKEKWVVLVEFSKVGEAPCI